jgi:hypothetical protein
MEDYVTYTGDESKKLVKYVDDVDRPGNYNFYYGKLSLTVHAKFNEISAYSYYFGYMGGEIYLYIMILVIIYLIFNPFLMNCFLMLLILGFQTLMMIYSQILHQHHIMEQ